MSTETPEVAQQTETVAEITKTPEVVDQEAGQEEAQETAKAKPEKTEAERVAERMERRIGRKTAEAYEAKARADAYEKRVAELEARLGVSGESRRANDVDINSVVAARAQEIVQARAVQDKSNEIVRVGKSLDGFESAIAELGTELPLFDEHDRPTVFMSALLDADVETKDAARILHYLGKNPEEAAEFVRLTATQIGRRIGQLQTKLGSGPKTQTSGAPQPLKTVNSAGYVEKDPSEMTDAEWYAWSRKRTIA